MKRRDPGIQKLAQSYNDHVKKMNDLICLHKAPRNAVAPHPIEIKGLFNLDVDDEIWDDIGLNDDSEAENLPLWLSDENIHKGIKGILLRDRYARM